MPYDLGVYEAVAAAYAQKRREKRALFERRQLEIHQIPPFPWRGQYCLKQGMRLS